MSKVARRWPTARRNTLDLGNSKKGMPRDEMTDPTFHPNANAIVLAN